MVQNSKTRTNLMNSFGESQARNRYTFFSSVAKKAGYEQISEIFTDATTRRSMRSSSTNTSWI